MLIRQTQDEIQILHIINMASRHDYFKQECQNNEPEMIGTHSDGTVFYRCKNCNYFGTTDSFTKPYHTFEITQQH